MNVIDMERAPDGVWRRRVPPEGPFRLLTIEEVADRFVDRDLEPWERAVLRRMDVVGRRML